MRAVSLLAFLLGCASTTPAPPAPTTPVEIARDHRQSRDMYAAEMSLPLGAELPMGDVPCADVATRDEARRCIADARLEIGSSRIASPACFGFLCAFAELAMRSESELAMLEGYGYGPNHPAIQAAQRYHAINELAFSQLRDQELAALDAFERAIAAVGDSPGAIAQARSIAVRDRLHDVDEPLAFATSDVPEPVRRAAVTLELAQRRTADLGVLYGERHPAMIASRARERTLREQLARAWSAAQTTLTSR